MSADEGDRAVIRVHTRFASIDELVGRGSMVVSGETINVPATALPAVGERRPFQLLLADKTVALEGLGEVAAGKRFRIVELDDASRAVHERILAARKPLPRPSGSRAAPPPTRRTLDGPAPPPKPAEPVVAPLPTPPEPAPTPAPAPEIVAAPVPVPAPAPVDDDEPLPSLGWQLPPWLRSRRVRIGLGVTAAILLIGIIAAIAGDGGDDAPPSPAPVASAERIDGGTAAAAPPADAAPEPSEPEVAEVEVEDPEAAPPPPAAEKPRPRKQRAPKRTEEKKKSGTGRMVRLGVKSDPPGASISVDGESVDGGSVMVAGGSTVKVTAVKRGYRRVTRSVDVGKGKSIVIKLDRM